MPTLAEFCETLADRLRLDDSYLAADLPASVRRLIKTLLRDYHFPKAIRKNIWPDIDEGNQSYTLPADFKKPILLCFSDTSGTEPAFGAPLERAEGFRQARADGVPCYYWLEGTTLWTDVTVPADSPNTNLILVYESNDALYNLGWMLDDYEDVFFTYCMSRLAAELNKTELAQTWIPLWQSDKQAFAIYLNELEFEGMTLLMRPALVRDGRGRYPSEREA